MSTERSRSAVLTEREDLSPDTSGFRIRLVIIGDALRRLRVELGSRKIRDFGR
jgi:hypothetical protein